MEATVGGPLQKPALLLLGLLLAAMPPTGCSLLVEHSNAGIAFLEEGPAPVGSVSRGAKYLGWTVGGPLVLALTPVALVAWATPWVELPDAVDIASAPSVGLGYAVEALIGFPTYGVFFWRSPDASAGRALEGDRRSECIPWGFVIEHSAPPSSVRPAVPAPREVQAYYAVTDSSRRKIRDALTAATERTQDRPISVPLDLGVPCTLEWYPAQGSSSAARPLVLMTPPQLAAFAARYLARRYARRGAHAAVLIPDGPFLEVGIRSQEIETKFRTLVVTARGVLRVLMARPDVDARRLLYLGVSAGGIFGAVLLAVEPGIQRAVLILPGSDLPRIITQSTEASVAAFRAEWEESGMNITEIHESLAREIRTDPLRLASHIDPRRVLLFLGAADTRVPIETGRDLWSALGHPETYLLSGNHDTACLCFGFILRRTDAFLLGD